ncbi:MAG: dephospho-CoA kinase [Nitrospirota bacterium]
MLLVGLTGNIGMGKSTVLQMFKDSGAAILDADSIVESLLTEKKILDKIRELLGGQAFNNDGNIDKGKVANLIFKDDILRLSLEDLLHPLVFERLKDILDGMKAEDRIVVVEIPLLFERGYECWFDRTITVYTTEEIALNRLEKDGIKRDEALARLRVQLSIGEKIKKADFLIDNNGTIEETRTQARAIYQKLSEEAGRGDYKRSRKFTRQLS